MFHRLFHSLWKTFFQKCGKPAPRSTPWDAGFLGVVFGLGSGWIGAAFLPGRKQDLLLQGLIVAREQAAHQKERNGTGHDLFGRDREPEEREIGTRDPQQPFVFEQESQPEQEVAPAVCDQPGDAEAN